MTKPMTDMTDAELAASGWDFATRDIHGGLVSIASADYGDIASQRKEATKALRTFIDLRPLVEPPTVPAPIHKTCWRCDTPKPVTAFHWRNRARGVRHSSCKACRCEDERDRDAALPYPPGLWKDDAPRPLPWGYGMTPKDVAAIDEAAEDARHIPATTPASVVDPAEVELLRQRYERERNAWQFMMQGFDTPEDDPDPMGDGSAWGWVTVATAGALVALVGIIVWVTV